MIPWFVFAAIYLMIGIGVAAELNRQDEENSAGFLLLVIVIWPVAVGVMIQRALEASKR